jgi:biotin carboxylase
MRSLVILGAADGAVPTYVRARELGYRTICVDYQRSAPAVRLADEYLPLSTRDPDGIAAALAGRADIAGVLAPASDAALPAQAWLNRHWHLMGSISPKAVRASVDKAYFRAVCARLGFPAYRSIPWDTVRNGPGAALLVLRAAKTLKFPVLVKPVDGTGSRGVILCPDSSSVDTAVRDAARHSRSARVIIEEYVGGASHTVEAVIDEGEPVLITVTDRTITHLPHFITTSHAMPAALPADTLGRLEKMLAALCTELDYQRGPLNLDLIVDADGEPHLIEMGARVGGNGMAELVTYAYQVDTLAASIAAATGEPMRVAPGDPEPVLLHILTAPAAGRLVALGGMPEVAGHPHVRELRLFVEPGQQVRPYTEAANKLGYLVLAGGPMADLRALAHELQAALDVQVDPQR